MTLDLSWIGWRGCRPGLVEWEYRLLVLLVHPRLLDLLDLFLLLCLGGLFRRVGSCIVEITFLVGSAAMASAMNNNQSLGGGVAGAVSGGTFCSRCSYQGHDQINCPNRPRKCYRCRQSGHIAAECPDASDDGKDAVALAIDPENVRESVLHSLCQYVKTCPRAPWCPDAKKPWDTIGMGIVGPFTETAQGNRFLIFAFWMLISILPNCVLSPALRRDIAHA